MERLTNIGSNGEIWITDNDETIRLGRKESAYKKLAEYEDLEERLNGVSVKQVVDGFIKTVENQTNEEYEHGRILTNAEADKWNEYKQLEEQGLLLRLPCKIGDTIYEVSYENREFVIKEHIVKEFIYRTYRFPRIEIYCENENGFLVCNNIGKLDECLFLTQEEAEQKLKEMESD